MLLRGGEFGRTQNGKNNAYGQENEVSGIDRKGIDEVGRDLLDFPRRLIQLRQSLPILRRGRFLTGTYNEELDVKDVTWLNPDATEMTPDDWQNSLARCIVIVLDGRAQPTGIRRDRKSVV